ncbi:hypothetical protein M0804_012869 [Polistes exclamans]|nr:hypothetical protein M0804_012869 [Polistes exclamans]
MLLCSRPPTLRTCPICSLYSEHLPYRSSSLPLSSRSCPESCTLSRKKIGVKYLQDVSSCPKFSYNMEINKVKGIKLGPIQTQMFQFRCLHNTRIHLGKSKSDSGEDCKSISEICKTKEDHCNIKTCCKDKDAKCYEEKVKCPPVAKCVKEKKEEVEKCPTSCVRGGKCIITHIDKPAKMVYGTVECPSPKLIKPRTCPTMVETKHDESVCTEKRLSSKPKKEVCLPPPLPGPPTEPVSLCPCPPPPKMHPGPCPCHIQKEEISIKPNPPCLVKDKYPCRIKTYYCPPKKPCERNSPCDDKKDTKS